MKKTFTLLYTLLLATYIYAQSQPYYTTYNWEETPEYSIDNQTSEDVIELKNNFVVEFFFPENDGLTEYYLEHRVIWLNSDSAIEEYNKVYLPAQNASSNIIISKARVIQKNGSIKELTDSDILTAKDEETGKTFKYFAFEGIEKGSFIEYYYVQQNNPDYQGARITLQSAIEKQNVSFSLFAPKNLIFKLKSYNGIPDAKRDTLTQEKLHWTLSLDRLEKIEREELAPYHASLGYVVYKLDKNLANNSHDITSYGTIAQNIYSYYNPEYSKKTLRNLNSFIKEATKNAGTDENTILRHLDYYIKTTIYVANANAEELSDLDHIISQKVANQVGLVKLYTACLKALNIKHEIVLTSNRRNIKFDKDFEATNFLSDVLFYFPTTKQYVSPSDTDSRLGFPPPNLTDNYGLFVKEMTISGLTSGIGKIQYIQPLQADKTIDEMHLEVKFNNQDMTTLDVSLERSLSGYYGMNIHPFMNYIKEDSKKEIVEGFATRLDENATIITKEIINEDPILFGVEPLIFKLHFTSDAFIEKAGNKYIFNIGQLIGQQIQMYQEKKRTLPLENEHTRGYLRTLKIQLPKEYQIANLDDLIIDNVFTNEEGDEILSFVSSYTIKDNLLTIKADEFYKQNIIPIEIFEQYRTVINSAADFNKISLVLEPKK